MLRSLSTFVAVLVVATSAASCRSQAPLPQDFQERVFELIQESRALKKGPYFSSPEKVKAEREAVLSLLLEQIENELQYVGLTTYPEAATNAKDLIQLADQVATLPEEYSNREVTQDHGAFKTVNGGFEHFLRKPTAVVPILMSGIVGFFTAWGLADGAAFIYDMVAGWEAQEVPESVKLDKALLLRLAQCKKDFSTAQNDVVDLKNAVILAPRAKKGLTVVFSYTLTGSNENRASWTALAGRGIAPGSKETGLIFRTLQSTYYHQNWVTLLGQVKDWLKERSTQYRITNHFLSVRVLDAEPNELLITGRVNVEIEIADQPNFIRWMREDYSPPDGISLDVEVSTPERED